MYSSHLGGRAAPTSIDALRPKQSKLDKSRGRYTPMATGRVTEVGIPYGVNFRRANAPSSAHVTDLFLTIQRKDRDILYLGIYYLKGRPLL